ncbi:hypothetical protein BCR34DRAFT_304255 [Clohesyomyces aquaticus]|uniref:Uncharacterized protein n=1 Tax=Clohesyomyces aquaticus TaxID=1231657 RepID=A0A1Y1ZRD6_9PLEO|nr:hypothetical protein BCR34DRAFT_304255 [Clohesyomyces aquaticus]
MSTRNRLLCTGITSRLLNCVRVAATAKSGNAPFISSPASGGGYGGVENIDMRNLIHLLCKAAIYSECITHYDLVTHPWYSCGHSRVNAADMHSVYALLGLTLEYSASNPNDDCTSRMPPNGFEAYDHGYRLTLDKATRPSTLLGDPICCAVLAGRIDMVQYLLSLRQNSGDAYLDEDEIWVAYHPPYYITPGLAARAINLSIQLQNLSMLSFLLRLEGPRNGGFGLVVGGMENGVYGEGYGEHVVRAVVHGNIRIVEMLFDALSDAWFDSSERYVSEVSRLKQRGFRAAVISAQTEVVSWFVTRGVDVDLAGPLEETTLEIALRKGFVNIVRVLLEAGAVVKERDWSTGMGGEKCEEGLEIYEGKKKTLYSRFVKALRGVRKETRMHAARGTKPHTREDCCMGG